jgi:hypothetical protein
MGWKNIKEHYRIAHAVCVTKEGICIGSPYIHNIIVIGPDGTMKKRYDDRGNEDLARYQREMESEPATLKRLVESQDSFAESIPVFTYDGGRIIEKRCEVLGWPNVTHDGDMMYENTFSADRAAVVVWAKRNAAAGVSLFERRVREIGKDLARAESELANAKRERTELEAA